MSPPQRKARIQPARGSQPKVQNTTGRIVNKTQPAPKGAPTNPRSEKYNDDLHDYLDDVKTPEQVKAQWAELQKAKSAAEATGDRLGAVAAKDAMAGVQDKAVRMGMSTKDLPNAGGINAPAIIAAAGAMERGEPLAKAATARASRYVAQRQAAAAKTPRDPSPTPNPRTAPKGANGSQGAYSKARVKQQPHKDCGKKLPYKDTESVKGTGLQKDHTPSSKAIYTAAMDKMEPLIKARKITRSKAESIATQATNNAPTIAIPADVHHEGNTFGSKNRKTYEDQKLYERDAKDLNGAAKRDTEKISEAMADKKHGCNEAYNKAAAEITSMDWNKFVDDAIKQGMKGK